MLDNTQPIYVAILNSYGDGYAILSRFSELLDTLFSHECSVSLVNGDTLCFRGLDGQEISTLMEATGSDYNYSYESPEDAWNSERDSENTAAFQETLYGYECGVLLKRGAPEYEHYSCNNPALGIGFYDEDQGFCAEKDIASLRSTMRRYVEDGVNMTYAIISHQGTCDSSELKTILKNEDLDGMGYSFFKNKNEVVYSVCKIDGEIREGFLEDLIAASLEQGKADSSAKTTLDAQIQDAAVRSKNASSAHTARSNDSIPTL